MQLQQVVYRRYITVIVSVSICVNYFKHYLVTLGTAVDINILVYFSERYVRHHLSKSSEVLYLYYNLCTVVCFNNGLVTVTCGIVVKI